MQRNRLNRSTIMSAVVMALSGTCITALGAETDAITNGLEPGMAGGTSKPVVFEEMVAKLFKRSGDSESASIMHAAIGMSGEATELMLADWNEDHANVLEELGDFRFYFQELMATFGWTTDSFVRPTEPIDLPYASSAAGLAIAAGDVLDLAKKTWVYGKEMNVLALYDAANLAFHHYNTLLKVYELTDDAVKNANIEKLVTGEHARFKEGYYSDAAAIARRDKAGEEEREAEIDADRLAIETDFAKSTANA